MLVFSNYCTLYLDADYRLPGEIKASQNLQENQRISIRLGSKYHSKAYFGTVLAQNNENGFVLELTRFESYFLLLNALYSINDKNVY